MKGVCGNEAGGMLAWLWLRALLWGRSRSPGVAAGNATAGLHVFSPHQDHTFDLPGNLSLQTLIDPPKGMADNQLQVVVAKRQHGGPTAVCRHRAGAQ